MPSPIGRVTPGAWNFSGASMNEIAANIPDHTKGIAIWRIRTNMSIQY